MPGSRSRSTPLLRFPVFVSWFLACVPGSPLVRAWRDEFMRLQQFANATQYIASLRRDMVDMQHISRCQFGASQVWSRRVSSVRSVCEHRLSFFFFFFLDLSQLDPDLFSPLHDLQRIPQPWLFADLYCWKISSPPRPLFPLQSAPSTSPSTRPCRRYCNPPLPPRI